MMETYKECVLHVQHTTLQQIHFICCKFKTLKDVVFQDCHFDNCSFEEIEDCQFLHSMLDRCFFFDARLNGVDFAYCALQRPEPNLDWDACHLYNTTVCENESVVTLYLAPYHVAITDHYLQIGCRKDTWAEWYMMTDEEIAALDYKALGWWGKWKGVLQQIKEGNYGIQR